MASRPCLKPVQLIRTVRQVSPHGDSFTPSDWPCDWTTRRPADPCLGQSSDRWRAFTLPINQLERKKNTAVCRHPQTHSFLGWPVYCCFTAVSKPNPKSPDRATKASAGCRIFLFTKNSSSHPSFQTSKVEMEIYAHAKVITGILVGLALTHLLKALARLVQHPGRLKLYWVHLVWVVFAFFYVISFWWWEFRLEKLPVWTFPLYLFVILYAVLL